MQPSSAIPPSLFESERFRLLVAGVTDYAIYMLSPEGIISSWNAGAQRFKGYKPEEVIGRHFSCFYTDEDRAINLPAVALQTALDTGKFEAEGWRVRKDGSRFWATVVIDPIFDDSGELIGYAKVTRDITERKRAEAALHASEEQFRLLVESITDYAIYILSPTGEITNWNTGAKRIKGYDQAEIIGSHFSRFYTDEERAKGMPMFALQTAAKQGRFESEGRRVRKDGSKFWAHVLIHPMRNALGELIGFAKITRDITEKRNAEETLRQAQEALLHAQKMDAIGKLTGGVAHDFNNLLSVIVNGLSVLRMTSPNEQSQKILDSMERSATRGAELTRQLLTFARQQPQMRDTHNINRVIRSFEAVMRRAIHSPVHFQLDLCNAVPQVMIDASQMEAALLNLVVNARDATGDEGTITLRTEIIDLQPYEVNQLPPGHYVKITVADTGEGIPPDVIPHVIEPFFTTKPPGQGTGLGLSQVYGFIRETGGDLTVQSDMGEGTQISLFIPLLETGASEDEGEASALDKALVVDDQPDVLEMTIELFRSLGYEVYSANSGEDALEILQSNPDIQVLFSDVVMPGISGIELGQRARTLNPNLNILLASGYPQPALTANHNELAEFHFISKPYRVADVIKKLRTA